MKIAATLLFLLLVPSFNYGQTPPEPKVQTQAVFDSFRISLDGLTKRFGKKSPYGIKSRIARSLESIRENVEFLEKVMTPEKQIPTEYLEGVSLDAELLQKLAARKSTTAAQLKTLGQELKEVDSDLMIKVTGSRAGGEIARVVEVFVHAKKGAQNVSAYQIWYVSKGWAKYPSHFKPFDRLTDPSNPSSMKLAPGNYFIWLSKGQPVTSRQSADIGVNGETRREIDVPIP